ncbi:hypothetical protein [Chitinimonas koreensis]|uniref:hypothetical protein n=1 Tax=Chitinimonas koreensis TaxID=356302 RepID=UPI000490D662|nr:hypothetical protein [Chitinimonas koreensis]QNM96187.1 hypothetical protein H9L41_20640 [Chitinimonas koreensis]
MKKTHLLAALLSIAVYAQDGVPAEAPAAPKDPLSSILLDETALLGKCDSQEFVRCLGIDKSVCTNAISASVQLENKAMTEELAGKELTEAQVNFNRGRIMGRFMIDFIVKSKTDFMKFQTCASKLNG